MTALLTGTTCARCGWWGRDTECQRLADTGTACWSSPWPAPSGSPVVLVIDGEVAVPDFKRFHEAETYYEAMVAIADSVTPRAKVSKREPELVGVAAWWANVPASIKACTNWSETTTSRGIPFRPWTDEQTARMHAKDLGAAYLDMGYSQEWTRWYCGPLATAHQARKAMTRREEYALYVSSGSGPAVDKLAEKLAPARKRSA